MHSHCGGTVSTRRPTLSINRTVTTTPASGERGEPDPAGEPAAEAVVLQHAVGEGGDREVRGDGAEPEHRDEQRGPPVLLGEQHPEGALAGVLVLDVGHVGGVLHVPVGDVVGLVAAAAVHSQRGDSGRPSRARNRITARRVLVPRMIRQSESVSVVSR